MFGKKNGTWIPKEANRETGKRPFWVEKNCPVDLPEMEKGDWKIQISTRNDDNDQFFLSVFAGASELDPSRINDCFFKSIFINWIKIYSLFISIQEEHKRPLFSLDYLENMI